MKLREPSANARCIHNRGGQLMTRSNLAFAALIGHAPLLVWLTRRPLRSVVVRHNAAALLLTIVGVGIAWRLSDGRWQIPTTTFAVGHLTWGAWLARLVRKGAALAAARD